LAAIGNLYGVMGRPSDAQKVLQELRNLSEKKHVTPYGVALVYAGLGDKDSTFSWLQRAYTGRSHWLVWLKLDPRWSNVRPDPRFEKLARRLNLPK